LRNAHGESKRWFKDARRSNGSASENKNSPDMASMSGQPERKTVMQVQPYPVLCLRTNQSNANHHIWNNNGTWYLHYTVQTSPITAERVRRSLKTKDIVRAREIRDQLLKKVEVPA